MSGAAMTRALPIKADVAALVVLPLLGWLVGDGRLALILAVWLGAWAVNARIARRTDQRLLVAAIFGITLLVLWEMVVQLYDVPLVILPPPTDIAAKFAASTDILWRDFVQTFVKGALSGYVIGCGWV